MFDICLNATLIWQTSLIRMNLSVYISDFVLYLFLNFFPSGLYVLLFESFFSNVCVHVCVAFLLSSPCRLDQTTITLPPGSLSFLCYFCLFFKSEAVCAQMGRLSIHVWVFVQMCVRVGINLESPHCNFQLIDFALSSSKCPWCVSFQYYQKHKYKQILYFI